MSGFSLRKAITGVAIAALATSGLMMGAGAAQADTDHPSTKTVTSSNLSITRSIVGDGEVAPGGYVTIRTTVSATGHPDRYVNKFVDRYPAGLTYKEGSATVDSWHLIPPAQKTESVSPSVNVADRTVTVPDAGWLVSPTNSKTVTYEVTYLVSPDAVVGSYLSTGVSVGISFFATEQNVDGVFVKIRGKNAGEAVTSGSADLGFGSSDGEGGTGSAGSSIINNPADFIADIISGVLGNGS